jgi:phage tail sheath gpL-like
VNVEITIGVQNVTRELVIESDQTADQVSAAVSAAIAGGPSLTLTDARGRRIIVPTAVLGYVEIGTDEQRRVGFGGI